ncbi:MAG: hypothetical protein ACI85K_002200, partial [Hyphomicrobiaceae bacterium]
TPLTLGLGVTDIFGYTTISTANPNSGALTGFTIMVQGVGIDPAGFQLSSPVIVQLQ